MTHFRLYPDVYLVNGTARALLYDISRKRMKRLSSTEAGHLSAPTGSGDTADRGSDGRTATAFLDGLVHEEYGAWYSSPAVADRYVWAADRRQLGFFEPELVVRAAFIQLTSRCQLSCYGCGAPGVAVWQGCNSCRRWPETGNDATIAADTLKTTIDELCTFTVRTIFLCGGNPLLVPDLLIASLEQLRAKSFAGTIVVTTNGQGWSPDVLQACVEHRAKLNFVMTAEGTTHPDCFGAAATCREFGVPFYVTIDLESDVDAFQRLREKALERGAERVLSAERTKVNEGMGVPLKCIRSTDTNRAVAPGTKEFFTRLRHNPCLHGLLAVAADGTIRPCPMIAGNTLGDTQLRSLRQLLQARRHEHWWSFTKDRVPVCGQCEYRYACVDCTAVDLWRAASLRLKTVMCTYDPAANSWPER